MRRRARTITIFNILNNDKCAGISVFNILNIDIHPAVSRRAVLVGRADASTVHHVMPSASREPPLTCVGREPPVSCGQAFDVLRPRTSGGEGGRRAPVDVR